ncbi:MAG: molybdopterin-guanine dinucleotide biosynthesis protein B [Chloroflexia bacterium]|nr:molybdopterin-guanine dinucleotide biosynthesis protein B [Chloroflexia bacterium]
MSVPLVCIVGKSNSGKTTFLEKLLPELGRRGYRVAVVKHDSHGFDMDQPGKDTWRLRQAGAWRVAISSPQRFALIGPVEQELSLEELVARYLQDVDLVLTEGYKRSQQPKIELCRAARSEELICAPDELLAVISDLRFDLPCPQFDLDDVSGVADLLEARFLHQSATPLAGGRVILRVDGRPVPLKPYIQRMLAGAMRGLLGGLKDAQGQVVELYLEGEE